MSPRDVSDAKPILFGGPMVRAILAGKKTQTRRLVKLTAPPYTNAYRHPDGGWVFSSAPLGEVGLRRTCAGRQGIPCPYGVPGDRLWVRETWAAHWMYNDVPPRECNSGLDGDNYWFRADGNDGTSQLGHAPGGLRGKWRPAIFLPRWASRITLEVTDVRLGRLHDISEEDAQAEGLTCLTKDGGRVYKWGIPDRDGWPGNDDDGWHWREWSVRARDAFAKLWDAINGKRAPWASNPWLWVVSFRRLEGQGLR